MTLSELYDATQTMAELLLDIVAELRKSPGVVVADWTDEAYNDRVKLAYDLYRRPALAFRAMVEGWDLDLIVRELRT